jgi:hypothetical protein
VGDLQAWAGVGVVLGVIVTAITLAVMVGKPLRRLARQNDEFREDWYGVSARPGRDAVPGVPERLRRIEQEFRTNGGSTLRDAVGRLETRLEDHIRSHNT